MLKTLNFANFDLANFNYTKIAMNIMNLLNIVQITAVLQCYFKICRIIRIIKNFNKNVLEKYFLQ